MDREPTRERTRNGAPRRDAATAGLQRLADAVDAAVDHLAEAARLIRSAVPQRAEESRGPSPPRAPDDRLTSKQLGAIHGIARRAGMSRDRLAELVRELTGNDDVAALDRAEASAVIDRLRALNGE